MVAHSATAGMNDEARGLLRDAAGQRLLRVPDEIRGLQGEVREVLGIRLAAVRAGFAIAELTVQEQHLNVRGAVQGGVLASIADAAAGWACDVTEGVDDYATIALSGNLVGAARLGDAVRAEARTVHAGRRTCTNAVEVFVRREGEARERTVAHFQCTQLILS